MESASVRPDAANPATSRTIARDEQRMRCTPRHCSGWGRPKPAGSPDGLGARPPATTPRPGAGRLGPGRPMTGSIRCPHTPTPEARPLQMSPLLDPFIASQHPGRPLDCPIVPPRRLDKAAPSPLAKPDEARPHGLPPPPSAGSRPTLRSIPIRARPFQEDVRQGRPDQGTSYHGPYPPHPPATPYPLDGGPLPPDLRHVPPSISNRIRTRHATPPRPVFPRRTRASHRRPCTPRRSDRPWGPPPSPARPSSYPNPIRCTTPATRHYRMPVS